MNDDLLTRADSLRHREPERQIIRDLVAALRAHVDELAAVMSTLTELEDDHEKARHLLQQVYDADGPTAEGEAFAAIGIWLDEQ